MEFTFETDRGNGRAITYDRAELGLDNRAYQFPDPRLDRTFEVAEPPVLWSETPTGEQPDPRIVEKSWQENPPKMLPVPLAKDKQAWVHEAFLHPEKQELEEAMQLVRQREIAGVGLSREIILQLVCHEFFWRHLVGRFMTQRIERFRWPLLFQAMNLVKLEDRRKVLINYWDMREDHAKGHEWLGTGDGIGEGSHWMSGNIRADERGLFGQGYPSGSDITGTDYCEVCRAGTQAFELKLMDILETSRTMTWGLT